MFCEKIEYGADVDGLRSIMIWECEIDSDDEYDIIAQIIDGVESGDIETVGDTIDIELINPITDEMVYFEDVPVEDYLSDEDFRKIEKEFEDVGV